MRVLLALLSVVLLGAGAFAQDPPLPTPRAQPPACPTSPDGKTTYHDYQDTQSGKWVRQIVRNTDGNTNTGADRDMYHYRNPWNSDMSYMLGVRNRSGFNAYLVDDLQFLSLYTGNGCFLRELWNTGDDYSWEIVWSKTDPKIVYTRKGSRLYAFNVDTLVATELFNMGSLSSADGTNSITVSPSLNQDGSRIMVVGEDLTLHTWPLTTATSLGTRRQFKPDTVGGPVIPTNCDKRNWRYVGWGDVIVTDCRQDPGNVYGSVFYDEGTQTHILTHAREVGHTDLSNDGKWAYFVEDEPTGHAITVHLVTLSTGTDVAIGSLPAGGYDGSHLTWPRNNPNFFILGFFAPGNAPVDGTQSTTTPYTQVYKITATNPGVFTVLGNTWTTEYNSTVFNAAGIGGNFWTQPEPAISADGSRILFNGNCDPKPINSATPVPAGNCQQAFEGDLFILFTDETTEPPSPPTNPARPPRTPMTFN